VQMDINGEIRRHTKVAFSLLTHVLVLPEASSQKRGLLCARRGRGKMHAP
jgi:hypothetical protein